MKALRWGLIPTGTTVWHSLKDSLIDIVLTNRDRYVQDLSHRYPEGFQRIVDSFNAED